MDATEFFKVKNPPSMFVIDDGPSGCKRSSIIRIRNEKKGMVSKSVETFTRPAAAGPIATPSRGHATQHRPPMMTSTTPRRVSARMGVATAVRVPAPPMSTSTAIATTSTRRQTLTGIRTTPSSRRTVTTATPTATPAATKTVVKIEAPKIVVADRAEPIYANVAPISSQCDAKTGVKSRLMSDKRHDRPVVVKRNETQDEASVRKSKRLEGRRHLTIG